MHNNMRLIPGKTKVQIELFKGVTLADFFVSAIAIVVLVFIIISTLPYKFYIIIAHVSITAALLLRLDAEPNYMYLLAILRHYALPRRFERIYDDKYLINLNKEETKSDALDELFREEP